MRRARHPGLWGAAALLLSLALHAGAQAQTALPPLDLRQAWLAAQAQDPTLRAARAAATAGQEPLQQALAQLRPQLSLSANAYDNQLDTAAPGLTGATIERRQRYTSHTSTFSLRQPVLQIAQRAAVRQARAQGAEADAGAEQARQQLAARVVQAYFERLLADDQVALVRAQTISHEAQLAAARRALEAGSGTRTDIDEAQARLDLDAAQALEAEQVRDQAQRQLQQLVGEDFGALAPLDPRRLTEQPPEIGALEDWLLRAEQHSPELAALRARLEAASEEREKLRARHLPTVDLVGQYSRGASDNINRIDTRSTTVSLGLQLNVPLYDGGSLSSVRRQADAETLRAQETLAATRLDLTLRLQREHRAVTAGLLRIKALDQAVRSSEQVVTSSRRSYQAGLRTTLDVLNAEQQLATAQRDRAQARYVVLLSLVRLQALAGVFDETALSQINDWLRAAPAGPEHGPIVSN